MSVPPDQPMAPVPPEEPSPAVANPDKRRLQGAVAAAAAVLVSSAVPAVGGFGVFGLAFGTVAAVLCVVLGSILTIFESTRMFAVGFLIASAVLIFVTAGVCAGALRLSSGQP